MTHIPTSVDVASDLRRCIHASMSEAGFEDNMYKECWEDALSQFKIVQKKLDKKLASNIDKLLHKKTTDANKRREDLLTASILLLS